MIGFAVMRLQPMHKGHEKIINTMLLENEKCFLLLGSIDKHDENNPLSYEERREMVEIIYKKEIESGKLSIFPVEDIDESLDWVAHVIACLPAKPDCYYCGTGQDGQSFLEKGFKLREFDRQVLKISSTIIRKKIRDGDITWKHMVSSKIAEFIEGKNI